MECYDFASGIAPREQIAQMLSNGSITEETKALVKLPMIERFLESELGVRMRAAQQAGRLYREKAFVMGFTQKELAEFGFGERKENSETDEAADGRCDDEDLTLIQGIIDVFWEEDDGLVVLDYKTDRVDTGRKLAGRYAAQLVLYGEALERLYRREMPRGACKGAFVVFVPSRGKCAGIEGGAMGQILLASASPRRKELLEQIGISFDICPAKGQDAHKKHAAGGGGGAGRL